MPDRENMHESPSYIKPPAVPISGELIIPRKQQFSVSTDSGLTTIKSLGSWSGYRKACKLFRTMMEALGSAPLIFFGHQNIFYCVC